MTAQLQTICSILLIALTSLQPIALEAQYQRISNPNLLTIKVDPLEATVVDLEDMADSVQVLKLENSPASFFGHVAKVLMSESRIFIHSGHRIGNVYVFDRQGKFLFKVLAKGQGPGELDRIANIATDGEELLVYGDMARKVLPYSKDGQFLSENKVDFYAYNFMKVAGDWVFNLQSVSRDHETGGKFMLTDEHFQSNSHFLPLKETSLGNAMTYSQFSRVKSGVQFSLFQNDTIFSLTSQLVKPVYFIGFGRYSISDALKNRTYGRDIFERLQNSNHAELRVGHTETENFLGFNYTKYNRNGRKDNRSRHVYYSLKNGDIAWHLYQLTLDRFGAKLPYAIYQYRDLLVTPVSFQELFEDNEEEYSNPARAGFGKGYGMMTLDEAFEGMREEDNPYLLFYKVKPKNRR